MRGAGETGGAPAGGRPRLSRAEAWDVAERLDALRRALDDGRPIRASLRASRRAAGHALAFRER